MTAFPDFTIKEGDTSPALRATLRAGGAAVSLQGASVRLHVAPAGGGDAVLNAAAGILDPATGGVVEYDWTSGPLLSPGSYEAEFEVVYADGRVETFPNRANITIRVIPQIA